MPTSGGTIEGGKQDIHPSPGPSGLCSQRNDRAGENVTQLHPVQASICENANRYTCQLVRFGAWLIKLTYWLWMIFKSYKKSGWNLGDNFIGQPMWSMFLILNNKLISYLKIITIGQLRTSWNIVPGNSRCHSSNKIAMFCGSYLSTLKSSLLTELINLLNWSIYLKLNLLSNHTLYMVKIVKN